MKNKYVLIKMMVLLSYLFMITINALANILPINNLNTGQVSDSFPNIFAPVGLTFSIWGLIYLLLGAYSVYQLFQRNINQKIFVPLNILFIFSSLVNSIWIFAWHYKVIWLTVILMLAILISLIRMADLINQTKLKLSEKIIYKIPFGIYFGWITIATIANITILLVSVGWSGFGISDTFWMTLVLLTGAVIGIWRTHKDSNLAYGLVPIWAYYGIWLKHTSVSGLNGSYPFVIAATVICILLFVVSNIILVVKKKLI